MRTYKLATRPPPPFNFFKVGKAARPCTKRPYLPPHEVRGEGPCLLGRQRRTNRKGGGKQLSSSTSGTNGPRPLPSPRTVSCACAPALSPAWEAEEREGRGAVRALNFRRRRTLRLTWPPPPFNFFKHGVFSSRNLTQGVLDTRVRARSFVGLTD